LVSLGSIVGAEDFEQTMADCFGSLKNPKNFFPRPPNIPILPTEMNLKTVDIIYRYAAQDITPRPQRSDSDAALLRLND
jgi:hypothetical protein